MRDQSAGRYQHWSSPLIDPSAKYVDTGLLCFFDDGMCVGYDTGKLLVDDDHGFAGKRNQVFRHSAILDPGGTVHGERGSLPTRAMSAMGRKRTFGTGR